MPANHGVGLDESQMDAPGARNLTQSPASPLSQIIRITPGKICEDSLQVS